MISTKEYMIALVQKHNILTYTTRETPPEAFVEWYNDHKEKLIEGTPLKNFDLDSAVYNFGEDLEAMYD